MKRKTNKGRIKSGDITTSFEEEFLRMSFITFCRSLTVGNESRGFSTSKSKHASIKVESLF